ncbi:hypothetical protein DL764_004286 [Monosporascus ibericus]|uniref:Uncharacterized protein n=1 Tax=Monosporascus ibericus TaxID=155417 RepID=A0A4Q4TGL3_9PEZI|nr:hypothetical protein DL764_004286 [Monosporascus ibericus]
MAAAAATGRCAAYLPRVCHARGAGAAEDATDADGRETRQPAHRLSARAGATEVMRLGSGGEVSVCAERALRSSSPSAAGDDGGERGRELAADRSAEGGTGPRGGEEEPQRQQQQQQQQQQQRGTHEDGLAEKEGRRADREEARDREYD